MTKLYRKQVLIVLYQICVLHSDPLTKMVVLASDWLKHIWPLQQLKIWTKIDRKQELKVFYKVCKFRADPSIEIVVPTSDWPRPFLCNGLTEFYETWQETSIRHPYQVRCFSDSKSVDKDGHPSLGLADTFSTSSLRPLNGILRNLTESKHSTSSIKFVKF